MKKLLFIVAIFFSAVGILKSQCVPTCSNYVTYTVPYAPYPTGGNNAIPLFTPNTDDGLTPPLYIGFNFNFYCTTYSTVLIYTNGIIQFDIGAPSTFPLGYDAAQLFPNGAVPNGLVAFRMDDLDATVGGAITYTTLGTSPNQTFVVTYSNVPLFSINSNLYSGQIALMEGSNMIDIVSIANPAHSVNYATEGIENASGTMGLGVPGPNFPSVPSRNQTYYGVSTPDTWRFQPVGPAPLPVITGTASICEGLPATYSINAITGATGYNWSLPTNWMGSSTTSAITATTGAAGTLSLTATFTCGVTQAATIAVNVIPSPIVAISSASPVIFCSGATVTFVTTGAASYTLQPGNMIGVPPFFSTPAVSTGYTLTGTNASGCLSKNLSTSFITVKETPTVSVNSGAICIGQNFVIVPAGANTYTNSAGLFSTVTPTTAGTHTYSVVGTSTNGCLSNTAICSVTVNALPTIGAVATRTGICVKESTSLTASGAVTYTLSLSTPNASNTVVSVNPLTTTVYSVSGTDAKGCVNTQTISLKVSSCTGILQISEMPDVSIFPNPAKTELNIKINSDATLNIYNMLGQKVLTAQLNAGTTVLPVTELMSGNYLVEISDGQLRRQVKIVIE